MHRDSEASLAWIRTGGVCGVLSIVSYLAAAFAPLPDFAGYLAAFAFGPLVAVGSVGLRELLTLERRGPVVDVAALFGVAAGVTVLIMLTVQQSIFALTSRALVAAGESPEAAVIGRVREGLNSVHLGIDVAWDVLIAAAVGLFGIAMLRHPRFGRFFGALGIALGALLLGFNLWFFPVPPANAESIDWGPFVALWILAAFVLQLRAGRWARERLTAS